MLVEFIGCYELPENFRLVLESFIDFSLISPTFLLVQPRELLNACILASYRSTKRKPVILGEYIEMI